MSLYALDKQGFSLIILDKYFAFVVDSTDYFNEFLVF